MNAPRHSFTSATSPSACDRVLVAVRLFFREFGRSPSHGDIQIRAGVHKGRVGRYLDQLQSEGMLTWTRGVDKSIVMVRRFENASREELIAECLACNLVVSLPHPVAAAFNTAFPADMAPNCPLEMPAALNDIPSAKSGERSDGPQYSVEKDQEAGRAQNG